MIAWFQPFREAARGDDAGGSVDVVIMTAGPGNVGDGNFYPPDAVSSAAPVFEGAKCFIDHPASSEEEERPERTMRDVGGWFSGARGVGDAANVGLRAILNIGGPAEEITRKSVDAALRYQMQYHSTPDRIFAGFSINAEGPSHVEETDVLVKQFSQFAEKLKLRSAWNVVDAIHKAMSADLVTFPARGGRILSMREAEQQLDSVRWRRQLREAEQQLDSARWRQQLRNATSAGWRTRMRALIEGDKPGHELHGNQHGSGHAAYIDHKGQVKRGAPPAGHAGAHIRLVNVEPTATFPPGRMRYSTTVIDGHAVDTLGTSDTFSGAVAAGHKELIANRADTARVVDHHRGYVVATIHGAGSAAAAA